MIRLRTPALAAAALCLAAPASAAVVDVDTLYAKQPENSFLASGVGRSSWTTQSLTAGITGQLVRLDLQVAATQQDDLRVRFGAGEFTDAGYVPLWQGDIERALLPDLAAVDAGGLVSIDLSAAGISLVKGQVYAITLSSAQSGTGAQFVWVIGEVDAAGNQIANPPYPGGQAQGSFDAGLTWGPRGVDRTFRTWVLPTVPEPGTWALLIAGFGLVGAAARRRRQLPHPA